jgi:hypothetical protein
VDQGELLARLETVVDRLETLLADHETRLRSLEQNRWKLAGAFGLAVFLIPIGIHLVLR